MFTSVGGLVEQSMIRSERVSSDIALHREAVVVSCWDRPCKLAALMNLVEKTTDISQLTNRQLRTVLHGQKQQTGRPATLKMR